MSDSKYSILFMRDDKDVRAFRLNPFWLKALLVGLVLLVVTAVAGVYFGATSLLENLRFKNENKELVSRLSEAELRLSSLANMEKILESYDSREVESMLTTEPAQPEPVKSEPTIDLNSIFSKVDTGAVRLEDLKLEIGPERVEVMFNLLNNLNNTQLAGAISLALVTNDGRTLDLEADDADLSFQIQRRKPVRAQVALPEGVAKENVFGLRLTVKRADGKVVYSETYSQSTME
ncbi:MAG: hypothetical protein V3573_00070 [Desulfovibrionaceae bacterium]